MARLNLIDALCLGLLAAGIAGLVFYIIPNIEFAIVALDHITGAIR